MNDIKRIEEFLNIIKTASRDYGYDINSDMVYANLIRLGINVVNTRNIGDNFVKWESYFSNKKNIKAFVDPRWSYFCQFTNDKRGSKSAYNKIKMYIPVDDAHIYESANRIFTFLADNNISHHSKIGKHVRFDDIVLRVDNMEDANKIRNFVMNDPYIREGLMQPNPFAFNDGHISYAWDGWLSFNTTLAAYISDYINTLKEKGELNTTSYKGFITHVTNLYNNTFEYGKNINEYAIKMNIREDELNENTLVNYESVTRMLLCSMMPDKNMEQFYSTYSQITSYEYQKKCMDKMHKLLYKENSLDEENVTKLQFSWNEMYKFMVKKYGYDEADHRLLLYMNTGNCNYFTRDGGVRNFIISNNITPEVLKILFVNMDDKDKKGEMLNEATLNTYFKYGDDQVMAALENGHNEGYFLNFTNTNNGRKMLIDNVSKGEIAGLVMRYYLKHGVEIKDIPNNLDKLFIGYIELLENERKNNHKR